MIKSFLEKISNILSDAIRLAASNNCSDLKGGLFLL